MKLFLGLFEALPGEWLVPQTADPLSTHKSVLSVQRLAQIADCVPLTDSLHPSHDFRREGFTLNTASAQQLSGTLRQSTDSFRDYCLHPHGHGFPV